MSKYRNIKTTIDGITFDSRKEADRYCELKLLQRAGEITDLELQVPFTLIPAFSLNGKKHTAIKYVADFVYRRGGKRVVEDVKGMRTDVYKLKKKLFAFSQNDEIQEV